jgi:hypothetical protein
MTWVAALLTFFLKPAHDMFEADLGDSLCVGVVSDLARSLAQGEEVAGSEAVLGVDCLCSDCGIAATTAPAGGGASAAPGSAHGPVAQDMLCRSTDSED